MFALLALPCVVPASAETLTGGARIIDADTVEIGVRHTEAPAGRHHRLYVTNEGLRYMRIGYARVSKADGSQSLDLQREALRAEGIDDPANLYHDFASGADATIGQDSTAACAL